MVLKIKNYFNNINIFLVIVFCVGILTIIPYGGGLDQTMEQRIMYANIMEYLEYLPGEATKVVQDMKNEGVITISENVDRDHGMAAYYPMFPIWYLKNISPYVANIVWHIYVFILVFWGMCSFYCLLNELFCNKKISAFMVLVLFLTPRMFAECHYNNKDMVLMSLYFTMFYWGYRLLRDKSVKSVLMLSFSGALASNLKIIGIWAFGIIGLYALIYFMATRQFDKSILLKAIVCVVCWIVISILITPACWVDMKAYFDYLFLGAVDFNRWHDWILFDGKMYHQDYTGMPRRYLPVLMFYTIPVITQLLICVGAVGASVSYLRSKLKDLERTGYIVMALFVGAVPLAYAVISATPLYNGWRHFYFVYASLMIGASYGVYIIYEAAKKHGRIKPAAIGGILWLAAMAVGIALNYPQEHSFYNVFAPKDIVTRYELDFWDMSVKQALEFIVRDTDSEHIKVAATNNPTKWGIDECFLNIRGKLRMRLEHVNEWQTADYVIINPTYSYMYSNEEGEFIRANYERVDTISSYGNVICEIYKKK